MKIALVAQRTTPEPAGGLTGSTAGDLAESLAAALTAKGHHVTAHGQEPDLDDAQLLARVGDFAGTLRDSWERDRPDVVHASGWTSGLAALAAARDSDVPVIQSFGSLAVAERRSRLVPASIAARRARMESAIGRGASAVIAGCASEHADLVQIGVPRKALTIIPGGVDTAEFTAEGPVAHRGPRRRLVSVTGPAGLDAYDELGTLLRALARVPDAELVIAGGPRHDDLADHPAHRKLASLAHMLGVADRMVFAGNIGRRALPALLRSADLLVSTSEYDPAGTAALEAMACGTPVVALARGGALVDAVVDGTTGILLGSGHPEALAQPIRKLLGHPMMLEAFSVAASDRVQSRYSWHRIADETLAVYESTACVAPLAA
jgi:glycosyltransferase involved in cell wall biosynthesis